MKRYSIIVSSKFIKYHSIRTKWDIIHLLIEINKILVIESLSKDIRIKGNVNEANINIIINVDKMSRIFIVENSKIHSFQYPFFISDNEIRFDSFLVDNFVLSIVATVFNDVDQIHSLEFFLDRLWKIQEAYDIEDCFCKELEKLIIFLFTFEPGYLRYDYDIERNSEGHPLNHFDFYYSSNTTFKIGLNRELDFDKFCSIVDINDTCYNLEML